MESLRDGYSRMDHCTKVCHFLQGIKNTELEAVVNIVCAQQKNYVSYLWQMVMKKGTSMQSIHIVRTRSQLVMAKVVAFMKKVEGKKYPKAVWKSMTKDQKMQVKKLCEQKGIKPVQSILVQKLGWLLLRNSSGLVLDTRRVMSKNRGSMGEKKRESCGNCQALGRNARNLANS